LRLIILYKIPIPRSYPTNPPALYGKPLPSKAAIPVEADHLVPEPVAQVEEEESDDRDVEDEELDEENTTTPWTGSPLVAGQYLPPPTIEEAAALKDIKLMLRPLQDSGKGYKDPKLDSLLQSQLEKMKMFLWNYADPSNKTHVWQAASLQMV